MGCGASSAENTYSPETKAYANAPKNLAPVASRGEWTDLHEEAEKGSVAGVKRNLRYDVNGGDEQHWTPLLEACEKRHAAVVDVLLSAKANPNVADNKGWTPIMAAAEGGNAAVARSLLNARASVDYQDKKGWTCIMEAAEKGNAAMVQEFVQVADAKALNTKDNKGWSAFMAACEGGNVDCVKLLWIHGAEHHTDYVDGQYGGLVKVQWTALDEAKQKGNRAIVAFMEPILEAEDNLKKMVETDDWKVEEALQYMERAQQVWCLKGLVFKASDKLKSRLEQRLLDENSPDRESCFDWLVNRGNADNNLKNDGNSNVITDNELVKNAMLAISRGRLERAVEQKTVAAIKWAMASAVKSGTASDLPEQMEAARVMYKNLMEIPAEWDIDSMVSEFDGTGRMIHKKPIEDKASIQQIQEFLDRTIRKKYTRDRRGQQVPDALKVVKLVSIQNEHIFNEYTFRTKQLPADCPLPDKMPKLLTEGGCPLLSALNSKINEAWLWHGTSQVAAEAITTEDFRLNLAGSNAGTLYGPGIYFGDSCSKSDEYTAPNESGLRCLLLCRVALGRVLYTDDVSPDTYDLTQKCLSHEYDSILGDREACRGTFKEFIIFDDDQAYPEFIVYYERVVH